MTPTDAKKAHNRVLARAWYAKNRKRRLEQNKRWRKANKATLALKAKQRHGKNKARDAARLRVWYQKNKKRVKATSLKWKRKNPQKVKISERKSVLWRKYGMTVEQYEALYIVQEGLCAICHEEIELQVDHDHATEQVRGLLCCRCNMGLGYFRDRPLLLRAAASYLDKARGQ